MCRRKMSTCVLTLLLFAEHASHGFQGEIQTTRGKPTDTPGRPPKDPDPVSPDPVSPDTSLGWETIAFPKISDWEAQSGFGCQYGICGWGNKEFQFYHPDPFEAGLAESPDDNSVTLTAKLDKGLIHSVIGDNNCTAWCEDHVKMESQLTDDCRSRCETATMVSVRLRSKNLFAFGPNLTTRINSADQDIVYQAIRVTMQVQVEEGTGVWPAVWMLPEDDGDDPDSSGYGMYGPWPYSGEIDIFESANNMRRQWSTIHFADSAGNDVGLGRSTAFNTREHTIEYIWRVGSMVWLIDGKVQQTIEGWQATVTQEGPTTPHSPFDQRFHLLINLALGGGLTGQSDPSAVEDMFRRKPGSMSTFRVGNLQVYGLPAE